MSDYPLLALGSYETYQLAHIATYIADRLARHRNACRGRPGREQRTQAVRDLAGAATALGNAVGSTIAKRDLPRPLDRDTYTAARDLLDTGPRTAEVVALAAAGRPGFAVVGHVPGVGAVGAHAPTTEIAEALRVHLLTRPATELAPWAVTATEHRVPTLPQQLDLAAFVEHLDPELLDDRAVARNLRGHDRRTDAAIRGRFHRVDLDAPPVLHPPEQQDSAATPSVRRSGAAPAQGGPAAEDSAATRSGEPAVSRPGSPVRMRLTPGLRPPTREPARSTRAVAQPATAAPKVPSTNAGP